MSKGFQLFVKKREQAAHEALGMEMATDLLSEGQTDASYISKLSRLSEAAVCNLSKTLGVAVL